MLELRPWNNRDELIAVLTTYLGEIRIDIPDIPGMADRHLNGADSTILRIWHDDQPIGFVILLKDDISAEIAEFRIDPPWRRTGLGTQAAHLAFGYYDGVWELGSLPGAVSFWRHALTTYPRVQRLTTEPSDNPHQSLMYDFVIGEADAP